jgi:beta-glucosidase/6-phospho-beta-glucosidase/beta-galactosidase
MEQALFRSFFLGGFECSSHRRSTGERLDLLAATRHAEFAVQDFLALQAQGIYTARSGIRWHLIETRPYHYDFSSALPLIRAAQATGTQVIWDIFHYGWPDDLDIFTPTFVDRFAAFAAAFADVLAGETDATPLLVPVNEISFVSWGGGDAAYLNPFQQGRGAELKSNLVRASIAAIEAIWDRLPKARIVQIDPLIHIVPSSDRREEQEEVEAYRRAQYQAWDMLAGREWPGLGGSKKYLDIIGVNFYSNNQWVNFGRTIYPGDSLYRPFREMLVELYGRYGRPLFIAETGAEGDLRASWFRYVADEVHAAMEASVPIEGICLYPILDYPGWDNDRHCTTGLLGFADDRGCRPLYRPLAEELERQVHRFERVRETFLLNR